MQGHHRWFHLFLLVSSPSFYALLGFHFHCFLARAFFVVLVCQKDNVQYLMAVLPYLGWS